MNPVDKSPSFIYSRSHEEELEQLAVAIQHSLEETSTVTIINLETQENSSEESVHKAKQAKTSEPSLASFSEHGAGINNGGATCYMSSVIQGLRHIPGVRSALAYQIPGNNLFIDLLNTMLDTIEGKNGQQKQNISRDEINTYREAIIASGFPSSNQASQEDASLFCQFLLGALAQNLFPFKTKVFHGLQVPIPSLDRQKGRELVISLTIGIKDHNKTLQDLVTANRIKECVEPDKIKNGLQRELTQDEQTALQPFERSKERRLETIQSIELPAGQVPSFLPLSIRRFDYQENKSIKISTRIEPSLHLDVPIDDHDGLRARFRLKAVVVHQGETLESGHYYTYVPGQMANHNAWLEFNDEEVFVHEEPSRHKRRAADAQSLTPYEDVCTNGYLFFYELEGYVGGVAR